jgi:hypothetical protein
MVQLLKASPGLSLWVWVSGAMHNHIFVSVDGAASKGV